MQISIDTPYVTVTEFAKRSGMPERTVREKIKQGVFVIRAKETGTKGSVLINLIHLTIEAAEQSERLVKTTGTKKDGSC